MAAIMTDQQLRELIEKATPDSRRYWPTPVALEGVVSGRLAQHIAAWSPDRALAALDVIEAVKRFEAGAVGDDEDREQAMYDARRAWDALGGDS